MNQYIITEDMLQSWRKGCTNLSNLHTNDDICKKCEYRGKGMRENCCDFDDNSMERIFRSQPYQNQRESQPMSDQDKQAYSEAYRLGKRDGRDKVLDELKWFIDLNTEIVVTQQNNQYVFVREEKLLEKIKELRGEQ